MSHPLFNIPNFLNSLADDEELARELLKAFMEDSPVRSRSLGEALDAGDIDQAAKLAHSLKGMCGVVRADDLANLALSMEHTVKEGGVDKTREMYVDFQSMLDRAHQEMTDYMNR